MTMIPHDRTTTVHRRAGRLAILACILLGTPCGAAVEDAPASAPGADGSTARSTDAAAPGTLSDAKKPVAADTKRGLADRGSPDLSGQSSVGAEKAAVDTVTAKTSIAEILARTLPRRTDRPGDWQAGLEPLHYCGEPRWIDPCIPPPPCHPALPPHPYDLVGVPGDPTCGPIYRGPCCPRTGTHDDGPLPRLHRVHDRLFDAFYWPK